MDDDVEREKEVEKRARGGRDEQGNLIRKPPPPAPPASATVRFGKPFSPEDRAKQSVAFQKFLRDRGEY